MSRSIVSDVATGGSTIDLIDLFWRRRTYIASCTIVAIVLGVIYSFLATPMYESTADVLVVQKTPQAVTGDHQYESGFEDYLATHLAIIASPVIIEQAIEASNLASLESFADLEDPEEELVDTILDNLEVEGGSRELGENADSIMTLSYVSSVPEDAPIVVQAILDSYEAFHHEVYRGMSDSTVDLIGQARDLLQNDLSQQEEIYSEFRQTSPLVTNGTDEVNPLQERLTAIEQRRSEVLLRRAEVESQLQTLDQARRSGADDEQLFALVTELRQRPASGDDGLPNISTVLDSQLVQLIDSEQSLLEHYGPNHPHVLTMRQRIADMRRMYALPSTAHVAERESEIPTIPVANTIPNAKPRSAVDVYEDYLQQELKSLKIAEDLLSDLYGHEHEIAKELSRFQLKDESYRRGIERTEALYDVVLNRLQEASLVKGYGGFDTSIIAPPRLGEKVSPQRRIILPVAMLAGIFLGCLLALFVEFRDDSFHSCEQIQQQLKLPVIGQIPTFARPAVPDERAATENRAAAVDAMLCAYHQPRTLPAESFRALRTSLLFNGDAASCRVLQVTGISPGDGASTIAANLAVSLAQAGNRVLLIDADLHEPCQHRLFGIDAPNTGLATLITSDVEPADAICPTPLPNVCLLSPGKLPQGPCELFTSRRFTELISWVRDSYDQVLIDTGALLSSSDPLVIASRSDRTLLTIRLDRDSRRRVKQAQQLIERVGVHVKGIVVNGSDAASCELAPVGTEHPRNAIDAPLLAEQATS